jgi:acyl homoserine lactone synthase
MNRILVATADEMQTAPDILDNMFRFRHKVFHDRLGWDVASDAGREIDGFDRLNPVYMVARNRTGVVEGCWRLLPTTGPYMLKDTFPELLQDEPAPVASDIWELSRFAAESPDSGDLAQAAVSPVTFVMFQAMVDFAINNGIRQYVTVTSVALERLLRRMGMPVSRFGDGKAMRIGKVLTVACRIEINTAMLRVVYPDRVFKDDDNEAAA